VLTGVDRLLKKRDQTVSVIDYTFILIYGSVWTSGLGTSDVISHTPPETDS